MTLTTELEAATASVRTMFGAAACSCALASDDGAELRFVAANGAGAENIVGVTMPVRRGIAGWVALTGQPIAIADVARDDRFARDIAEATEYVPTAVLAAPLLDEHGETMGVIEVLDPTRLEDETRLGGQRGTSAELAALTAAAAQVSTIVRLSRLASSASTIAPELVAPLAEIAESGPAGQRLAREVLGAVGAFVRAAR